MNKILNKPTYFLINIITVSLVMLSAVFFSISASAADQTVEMLNKLGKENMVFSKKIVKINIGEKVFWKGVKKGHNVEFI